MFTRGIMLAGYFGSIALVVVLDTVWHKERFNLRTLMVAMTVAAIMLAVIGWFIRH